MYKIAILGCENSHATSFLSLIDEGLYPDISVIGIYSDEVEPMEKLHERFGVPMMESFDTLAGQVDGIMITARHGDNHYKYAKPYIAKGIPMFIDKPITCREEDALFFMRDAMERNVRLCGGSTMALHPETLELARIVADKSLGDFAGGSIVCPYYPTSPYGGFHFYAQHLVDIMTAVFGTNIRKVRAQENANGMMLLVDYDAFRVQGAYIASGTYYSVSIYGKKGFKTQEITFDAKSFCSEMDEMLRLLNGGQMVKSYEEFVLPVFVMNAIECSVSNATWEEIPEIRIKCKQAYIRRGNKWGLLPLKPQRRRFRLFWKLRNMRMLCLRQHLLKMKCCNICCNRMLILREFVHFIWMSMKISVQALLTYISMVVAVIIWIMIRTLIFVRQKRTWNTVQPLLCLHCFLLVLIIPCVRWSDISALCEIAEYAQI